MKTCKRCLYPENHALGIIFDSDGVCSGCRIHDEKDIIDWAVKEEELNTLLHHYKSKRNKYYDCLIPVCGNSDSFFVVDQIKNKFGLNPLLVTYNSHFSTKIGVRNLARLVTKLDCDHIMLTVSPDIVKKVTIIAMHKIGDIYWHYLAGSQTFPVQVATKFQIPLIVWGVNGWLDQVGMFSHNDNVEMTKKVRKEHGLRGLDAFELLSDSNELGSKDIQPFTYPSDQQLEKSRVRGIYLGNYLRWDAKKQSEDMISKYGYETLLQERTFNSYESIFCWNNAGLHDYIKYKKFGYGKVVDHAARDIRLGHLSQDEAAALINKYDHIIPVKSLELFLEWIGLTDNEFWHILSPHLSHNKNKKFCLMDLGLDLSQIKALESSPYINTPILESEDNNSGYILMGRTYMDESNYKAVEG